ncbi:MAG: hypothetical protein AAF354_15470 [Pseudomonadota bacterium]
MTVRRGSLYISRDLCERYFSGLEAVILLRADHDLMIMPVRHAAAGGYLLKLRNSVGDRVVTAPDFFREQGWNDDHRQDLPVFWRTERAALCATGVFEVQS